MLTYFVCLAWKIGQEYNDVQEKTLAGRHTEGERRFRLRATRQRVDRPRVIQLTDPVQNGDLPGVINIKPTRSILFLSIHTVYIDRIYVIDMQDNSLRNSSARVLPSRVLLRDVGDLEAAVCFSLSLSGL